MQMLLMTVIALHVLSGVFWAGSTFVLARSAGIGAERLAYPQAGSAAVAVLAGVLLWGLTHRYGFGTTEQILAIGAGCAIGAASLQGLTLPVVRHLRKAGEEQISRLRTRIAIVQRMAAALLVITVICMAVARYA